MSNFSLLARQHGVLGGSEGAKNCTRAIRTTEVYSTIGTMGKKDVKREYYQVEEARRKRRMNCAT